MRYRTKPFEIDAVQFKGDTKPIKEAFPDIAFKSRVEFGEYHERIEVWDYLQQTWVTVNMFDYIIRGMKGEYYPCEQEVFEAKYEEFPKLVTVERVDQTRCKYEGKHVGSVCFQNGDTCRECGWTL